MREMIFKLSTLEINLHTYNVNTAIYCKSYTYSTPLTILYQKLNNNIFYDMLNVPRPSLFGKLDSELGSVLTDVLVLKFAFVSICAWNLPFPYNDPRIDCFQSLILLNPSEAERIRQPSLCTLFLVVSISLRSSMLYIYNGNETIRHKCFNLNDVIKTLAGEAAAASGPCDKSVLCVFRTIIYPGSKFHPNPLSHFDVIE